MTRNELQGSFEVWCKEWEYDISVCPISELCIYQDDTTDKMWEAWIASYCIAMNLDEDIFDVGG